MRGQARVSIPPDRRSKGWLIEDYDLRGDGLGVGSAIIGEAGAEEGGS